MRSLTVHPASLALGLVLGGIALFSMSPTVVPAPLRVEFLAHPRDMIQIREGAPYTVPAGRILVVTGLGSISVPTGNVTTLLVDGAPEAATLVQNCGGTESRSVVSLTSGLTVQAGSAASVVGGTGAPDDARAWGFLAPL